MALIVCPECGKEVSNTIENCIHCGFKLITSPEKTTSSTTTYKVDDDNTYSSNITTSNPDATTARVSNGYDVMLVAYSGNSSNAAKIISNVLNCSLADANTLIKNIPAYLYTDLDYNDAINLCRILQNEGMHVNLHDPLGKVISYQPMNYNYNYNQNYNNVARDPFFQILPQLLLANSLRRMTSRSLNSIPRTVVYQNRRPSSYRRGSNFFSGPGSKRR